MFQRPLVKRDTKISFYTALVSRNKTRTISSKCVLHEPWTFSGKSDSESDC